MDIISSKATIATITERLLGIYFEGGEDKFVNSLHREMLQKKVRFPVLEHAGVILYHAIPLKHQLPLTDKIIALHEIGSNVLAGIILQLRLTRHFKESIDKATEYIITGNQWYVCDIIGERVMGHALLTQANKTISVLKKLAKHEDKWIVRCVGVAIHYAVKKGLKKEHAEEAFTLLLILSSTTDFHTKKGIGWAGKTIAKFHPDIIAKYKAEIESDCTRQWFRTKIKIGLGRTEKYAHRYNS